MGNNSRVFINALTNHHGGGKTILINLLKNLDNENDYIVLVDNEINYQNYNRDNIRIESIISFFSYQFVLPFTFAIVIPFLLKKNKIDVVLNLSDAPIYTNRKQIFYFDWAFAVYPEKFIYERLGLKQRARILFKKKYFNLLFNKIDRLIVQTPIIKERIEKIYNTGNMIIDVIPVGKPSFLDNTNFKLDLDGFKLLYLTNYYPHKNMEILIQVAKKIKIQELDVKFIITLDNSNKGASNFLKKIKLFNLESIIINIGTVDYESLFGLYESINGAIVPTLIESYSSSYVESIIFSKPILTSNLDFAKFLCQDCAIYFDPMDSSSIFQAILKLREEAVYSFLKQNCLKQKETYMTWNQITGKIIDIVYEK